MYSDNRYSLKVVSGASLDGHSQDGVLESGCLVTVYDVGTRTAATIYSDKARTSKTNPITRAQFATDNGIEFYSSASSVDISVCYSDGSNCRYNSVTPNMRTLVLDRSATQKCLVVPFGASDNTETDTSIDLIYGTYITDVFIEVVTSDSTETIDVGILSTETAGDADGFINDLSVGTTGFVRCAAYTVGANETFLASSSYGALMGKFTIGTDVDQDDGAFFLSGHIVTGTNGRSISYTGSAGSDTAAGYIYLPFYHVR